MKRTLYLVTLGAILPTLTGCFAVLPIMAANIGAQAMIGKSMAKSKADTCYSVETKAVEDRLTAAETRRAMTTAGC